MSESLAQTVALYAAALALFSLATAVRGRGLGRAHAAAAVVLGAGAALDGVIAAVGRRGGRAARGADSLRRLPAAVGPRPAAGLALCALREPRLGRGHARHRRRVPCA